MDHGPLLTTILQEMDNGVVVCGPDAGIKLFNRAAADLLGHSKSLQKNKSVYSLFYKPPLDQALELLDYQHSHSSGQGQLQFIQFMNSAADSRTYFRCRLSFLEPESPGQRSFVLMFEDISAWYSPENPLFQKIEEFRAPMTNLRAAVETLSEFPEMSPVMRSAFENVLVQETLNLTTAFNDLAKSCDLIVQMQSSLAELDTEVLFSYLVHYLKSRNITVKTSSSNKTVKIDIYGLVVILDYLAATLKKKKREKTLSCEAHTSEQFVFIDFLWPGKFLTPGTVKDMMLERPAHSLGATTVESILHSMGADFWSQQHSKSKGLLRLALPLVKKSRP